MSISEELAIEHLTFLYGEVTASHIWPQLKSRLDTFRQKHPDLRSEIPNPADRLTERDIILITYADQVSESGSPPLLTLAEVLETYVKDAVSGLHILPFFPYSSDDGFSVIDYTTVNPEWGNWQHLSRLGQNYRLMFDAVINHMSRESAWFQAFLAGDPEYEHAFIVVDAQSDLSMVTRPRALPLLTPVSTNSGEKLVWTTFSDDQIDLNFADPQVLLRIIDVLLRYVAEGAEIIRLDAIAYLWKEIGTPCIHLEETHRVVQLFRVVLDLVAPGVMIISETNVPHKENISYFGDGRNEAQLVYQFPLPPLVLHAIARGDAAYLTAWAKTLELPSEQTTFYNFLASHDGVGVRPLEGLIPEDEIQTLAERVEAHGGHVSYKTNPDGTQSPYELNISYFDALSDAQAAETQTLQSDRFMVSQAIMLALQGVPAVYIHSLFGSRNDHAGVEHSGRYRSINRQKFQRADLESALNDPQSLRAHVFGRYQHLLKTRMAQAAFHPNAPQRVLNLHPALFALLRSGPQQGATLLCLHNVTAAEVTLSIPLKPLDLPQSAQLRDVISGTEYAVEQEDLQLTMEAYQVLWLQAPAENG